MISNSVIVARQINTQVVKDIKANKKWTYTNKLTMADTFEEAENKPLRRVNCARGVNWVLVQSGVFLKFLGGFYGKKGGTIAFKTKAVKTAIADNYTLVEVKGKATVNQYLKSNSIRPGSIVTYYDMNHTNLYLGEKQWYDTGHAYCNGDGEGALFTKFVGGTVHGSQKIGCILVPKIIPVYRVQCGAFEKKVNAQKQCKLIKEKTGLEAITEYAGNLYKVVLSKTYRIEAEAKKAQKIITANGIDAIIIERIL